MPRLAEAAGVPEAGEQLVAEAAERIEAVEQAVADAPRPRVVALEWLDPIYIGGHWVPQMIELAGGEDVLGLPGEKSRTAEWAEVEARRARGGRLDALRLLRRAGRGRDDAGSATGSRRSAPAWSRWTPPPTSRAPGPRLVDGVELLGHLLHPELVPAPPSRRSIELDLVGLAR